MNRKGDLFRNYALQWEKKIFKIRITNLIQVIHLNPDVAEHASEIIRPRNQNSTMCIKFFTVVTNNLSIIEIFTGKPIPLFRLKV